jgi:hypothetical protein
MYCNRIFAFRSLKCVVRLQTLLDCDSHLAFLPLACFKCGSVRPKNLFPDQNTGARRPQKHSQIKSPYESKPSLHPTEPQYCRRILLILPSPPFRNSILYPITCPPCLEQQNILRFCEKKSGALCLVLRGSSYIKRLQALGVWALVHSPTRESKST